MIDIPANWMEKVQNIDWSKVKASVKDYGPAIKVLQQTWSKESLLEISQGKLFVPDSVINEAIAKKIPEDGSVTGVTIKSHANGRLDIRAETKKVGPVELSGEIQEFVHDGDTSYMKYRVRSRNIPEHGLMSWVFSRVSPAMAERSMPSPSGPVCSTSLAYTGSSATTPPSSTANRSSEMVPSTMGRLRMKRMPSAARCHIVPSSGWRGAA